MQTACMSHVVCQVNLLRQAANRFVVCRLDPRQKLRQIRVSVQVLWLRRMPLEVDHALQLPLQLPSKLCPLCEYALIRLA